MSRVAVLGVLLSLLPPACAKLMGQAPPPPTSDVAPPPVPITSATTPPAWNQPEPTPQASGAASPSASAAQLGADLVRARAAADAKDFKRVRLLLEKKVRSGKCAPEESQLVFRACTVLKDRVCTAEVKAKHGEDLTE